MAVLDTFLFLFEGDASKLNAGLKDAEKKAQQTAQAISKTDQQAQQLGNSIIGVIKNFASLYIGTRAIQTFTAITLETAKQNVELGKQANALNMNVERLQQWKGAFEAAGSSGEAFTGFFEKLKKAGGNVEQRIMGIANRMKGMSEGRRRTFAEALGLDQEAVALLAKGSKGVEEYLQKEKELGLVTKEEIEQSKQFNEQRRITTRLMDDVKRKIAMTLLPALRWSLEGIQKVIRFMRENEGFAKAFFIGMATLITAMYIPALIKAITIAGVFLLPFLKVAAIATIIGLILDDINTYLKGGDSLIGRWMEKSKLISAIFKLIGNIIGYINEGIILLFNLFTGNIEGVKKSWQKLGEYTTGMFDQLMNLVDMFFGLFGTSIDGIKNKFSEMYEFVKGIFGWILDKAKAIGNAIGGVFGLGGGDVNIEKGQQILAQTNTPLANNTSNVMNAQRSAVNKNVNTNVGGITVNVQSDNSDTIAKGVGDSLKREMQGATAQFADGVAA